ncbi:MAG: methyltransferase [Tissierellia bacterium]|nr:methyltransferase [Tissierellia bacterium]
MDIEKLTLEIVEKFDIKIYQDSRYFKFGADAFALANFASKYIKQKKKSINYIDMCSGTGVIGILISKIKNFDYVTYVEINEYAKDINKLNLEINNINGQILNTDLRKLPESLKIDTYDYITINPPYMRANHGLKTINGQKDLAKIESDDEFLNDVFKVAFALLKDRGELFLVHRVERMADILVSSRVNKMEPKTLQFIRNKGSKKASIMMIRFVKNGSRFLECIDDYNIGG